MRRRVRSEYGGHTAIKRDSGGLLAEHGLSGKLDLPLSGYEDRSIMKRITDEKLLEKIKAGCSHDAADNVTPPSLYRASEFALRRMRMKIFDYDGTSLETKADNVLLYLKLRVLRQRRIDRIWRENSMRGPYSGLTPAELRATGTCETDWY